MAKVPADWVGIVRVIDLTVLRLQKLLWLVRRPRWWALLRHGVGPSLEHDELLGSRRYASVLDIGANVGQFALWADATLGPTRIVCVEPQPDAARRIAVIARRSTATVDVVVAALGDGPGVATLYVTPAADSSSLLRPTDDPVATTIEVPMRTGDDVVRDHPLDRPLLIKIDVQGTEDRVLRGLDDTLAAADAVLVEVSFSALYDSQAAPSDVVRFLTDRGFVLAGIARVPGVRGRWGLEQADLLFERP